MTLPGLVLLGTGDAVEGCLRALTDIAAAAVKAGAGASTVIHLPRLEVGESQGEGREEEPPPLLSTAVKAVQRSI